MLKKTKQGYYIFEKFNKFKGLTHGFSTRQFGDCSPKKKPENWKNIEKFLKVLGLEKGNLVLMEQVHGDKIKVVGERDKSKIIPMVDGLVTKERGISLGIKTADCLPILFYEPQARIIAAVHAGWRGVLQRLPQKAIDLIIRMGGLAENIEIAIGPHITKDSYNVDLQRINLFKNKFGKLEVMTAIKNDKQFLDLIVPTLAQFIFSGVPKNHIEVSNDCTYLNDKDFFSYRRDNENSFGEMLSVISLVN